MMDAESLEDFHEARSMGDIRLLVCSMLDVCAGERSALGKAGRGQTSPLMLGELRVDSQKASATQVP